MSGEDKSAMRPRGSQDQEEGEQNFFTDDMKQWKKTIGDDHGQTDPQAKRVGHGELGQSRVSGGYQDIDHDEDNEEDGSHYGPMRKSVESIPNKLEIEKEQLKERVLHGRTSELSSIMYNFVESKSFGSFIMLIILINTGILMSQTYAVVTVRASWYFSFIDNVFLSIYLVECGLKLYVYRRLYFKEGWNLLDFTIVVFIIVEFLSTIIVRNIKGFNMHTVSHIMRTFRAFRAIRALRVLRTIRLMSNLQVIMMTCLQSIQSMGAIVMLITLVLYMFAVIGRGLYFKQDPVRFGMLPTAAFTLFQLLTLDEWFDIYTDITNNDPGSWHIFIFLFVYIVMECFVFLNLFIAVLVDNFQLILKASNEEKRKLLLAQEEEEEEEDDDEDLCQMNNQDDDSVISYITRSSEQSTRLPRKLVSELYISEEPSEKDHLQHFFQCLAALEHSSQLLDSQKKTIDNIVDLCLETSDDVVT